MSRTQTTALSKPSLTRQPKASPIGTVYFTFAYTYAHNLDNASGFAQRNGTVPAYDTHFFYASGDSDVRHRISLSGGWDLPFNRMWAAGPKRLTQGWSLYPILTWRTGFPYDISAQLPDGVDPANPGSSGAAIRIFPTPPSSRPYKLMIPGRYERLTRSPIPRCKFPNILTNTNA